MKRRLGKRKNARLSPFALAMINRNVVAPLTECKDFHHNSSRAIQAQASASARA